MKTMLKRYLTSMAHLNPSTMRIMGITTIIALTATIVE